MLFFLPAPKLSLPAASSNHDYNHVPYATLPACCIPVWANFALSAAANAPNRLPSHRWPICCSSAGLLSSPLPLLSYLWSSLVRPNFVAVAAVAIGRCPVPSYRRRHCCIVDCRFFHAADATLSAPYSTLSSLQPHFCAHSTPPPTDRCLCVTYLVGTPVSRDVG